MNRASLLFTLTIGTCLGSDVPPRSAPATAGLPSPQELFRSDLEGRGGAEALVRIRDVHISGAIEQPSSSRVTVTARTGAFVARFADLYAGTDLEFGENEKEAWGGQSNDHQHLEHGTYTSDLIYNDPQLDLNYHRYFRSLVTRGIEQRHGREVYVVEAIDHRDEEHQIYFETRRKLRVGHRARFRARDLSLEQVEVEVLYSRPKVVDGWTWWSRIEFLASDRNVLVVDGFRINQATAASFEGPRHRWRPRTVLFRASDWSCAAKGPQLGFPLQPGRRWVYVDAAGEERGNLSVEPGVLEGEPGISILRARGLPSPLEGDRYVRWDRRGLRELAVTYSGLILSTEERRQILIPNQLQTGRRWLAGGYEARAEASEQVVTPAGAFKATRIHYERPGQPNESTRVWFAPKVGVVRIQARSASADGPQVQDFLLRSIEERCARTIPEMDKEQRRVARALLHRLSEPDLAASTLEIFESWGPSGLAYLEGAANHRPGPLADAAAQLRARMQRLTIDTSTGTIWARTDEPISWSFRIHNGSSVPTLVLPALDDSVNSRYPRYLIEVENERHEWEEAPQRPRFGCGTQRFLSPWDFIELLPGESIDPLGPGTFGGGLSRLELEPGTYRARLVYDLTEEGTAAHRGTGALDDEVLFLLEEIVRGRFVSDPVTLILQGPRGP